MALLCVLLSLATMLRLGLVHAACAIKPNTDGHVVIPSNWTVVGNMAFSKCSSLASVTIGDSVISIGERAFDYCPNLSSVAIGNGVREIGVKAFSNCKLLVSVTMGPNVKSILKDAFRDCFSLARIDIPEGVTFIGEKAFHLCSSLETVKIPDSVTSIEREAFCDCGALTSVSLGDGLKEIPTSLFKMNHALEMVTFGRSVEIIGSFAFQSCRILKSIDLPEGVTRIKEHAFSNTGLISINIPSSIANIENKAFGLTPLENVTIGATRGVIIGTFAFALNLKMTSFTSLASSITFDGDDVFQESALKTLSFSRSTTLIEGLSSDFGLSCKSAEGQMRCGCAKGYENRMPANSPLFACSPCQLGFGNTIDPTLDVCEMCSPGRFASHMASESCEMCPKGKFGTDFIATSESSCRNCTVGKYAPAPGSSTCLLCPSGSACPSYGTSEYSECDPGTYNSIKGKTQCLPCPSGTYGPSSGAAICEGCPTGRYYNGVGAKNESYCLNCHAGRYGDKEGLANCTVCPKAQYQPEEGKQVCKECTIYKTNNEEHTSCVDNEDLLGKSIVELLFKNNAAYYVSFSISAFFVAVCVAMHYLRFDSESNEQCTAEGGLGNLKLWQVLFKSALPGFSFGSEMVLLIAIFLERPSIGVAMVIFRLLHVFATVFFLIALFGSIKTETFVQKTLSDASNWKAELNKVFAASNIPIVGAILLLCVCDISLVQMLPWKRTDFYAKSNGFPSKSLMRFSLGIDMIQAGGSAICTIVYLAKALSSHQSDPTTRPEARLLFAMNISLSLLTLIMSLVVLFLKDRLLGSRRRQSLNKEMQGRTTPRTSATLELELSGIYDDLSDASDGTVQRQYSNPLHVHQSASDSAGYDQGISRAELDAKDAEIRKMKAELAAADQELAAVQLAHKEEIQRIMEATSAKNAPYEGQML